MQRKSKRTDFKVSEEEQKNQEQLKMEEDLEKHRYAKDVAY